MSISYQSYYKIIVKMLDSRGYENIDNVLKNQKTFSGWVSQNCEVDAKMVDAELYERVKDFIGHTCVNLRFGPDLHTH